MYLNTALPFYIYISTSSSFRQQLKRVIIKFYAFIMGKQIRREEQHTQTINNNNSFQTLDFL